MPAVRYATVLNMWNYFRMEEKRFSHIIMMQAWMSVCVVVLISAPAMGQNRYDLHLKRIRNTSWNCMKSVKHDYPPGPEDKTNLSVTSEGSLVPVFIDFDENNDISCRTSDHVVMNCEASQSLRDIDLGEVTKLDCVQLASLKKSDQRDARCIIQSKNIKSDLLGTVCGEEIGHVLIPDETGSVICSHCCVGSRYHRGTGLCERCPAGHTTNKDGLAFGCHRDVPPRSKQSHVTTTLGISTGSTPSTHSTSSVTPFSLIFPPSNLKAANVSADSVNLTWISNYEDNDVYEIEHCSIREEMVCRNSTTENNFIHVPNLTPKTKYSVKVAVLKKNGDMSKWSKKVFFTTTARIPSVKVHHISTVYSPDLTSFNLSWEESMSNPEETPYQGFKVVVQSGGKNTRYLTNVTHLTLPANESSKYGIIISVYNSAGDGPGVAYYVSVPPGKIKNSENQGLSPGAILGIIFGIIIASILGIAGILVLVRRLCNPCGHDYHHP